MVSKESIKKVTFVKLFGLKRGDRVKKEGYGSGNCFSPSTYGNVALVKPDGRVLWIPDRQSWVEWVGIDKLVPVFTERENWKGQFIDWKESIKTPIPPNVSGNLRYTGFQEAVQKGWIKLKEPRPSWYTGW